MGNFFSSSHLSRFFCCIIKKYLLKILFWFQLVSVCFTMQLFFSFKLHCLQMFQLFQTRDGPFFYIVTLVYICRAFFAVSSENIYPIYCFGHSSSQSVLQWNSFFYFKIHCLQMLQLFQTWDWPIFFIVTLVYICRAFFAVSSENIYPIYCFGHSWSQSISQWNSFSPSKYIGYKYKICFKPGMGQLFFIVTLVYTCLLFFAVTIKKYLLRI